MVQTKMGIEHPKTIGEIQNEIMDTIADSLSKEIDQSIIMQVLVEGGWTVIPFHFTNGQHAIDVLNWCSDNMTENQWQRLNGSFVFRNKKQAEWFILRWK